MKKGFTLIELLAVIAILAIIMIIATPRVIDTIENSRISAYQHNEKMMVRATKMYLSSNSNLVPENIGDKISVALEDVVNEEFLKPFNSPLTKSNCSGYVLIEKVAVDNYKYFPEMNCVNDITNPTDDGLVAYYDLAGDAIDKSLNSFDGVNNGATATVDRHGIENGAMYFENIDYIDLGTSDQLKPVNVTLTAWVKADAFASWDGIISNMDSWGSGFGLQIGTVQNVAAMVSGDYLPTGWQPLVDTWYYIAATHDSTTNINKLYVNGKIETQMTKSVTYVAGNKTMIGVFYTSPSLHFNGTIDEIRIYNRVLSTSEIKEKYYLTK